VAKVPTSIECEGAMKPISPKRQRRNREASAVRKAFAEDLPFCMLCRVGPGSLNPIDTLGGRRGVTGTRKVTHFDMGARRTRLASAASSRIRGQCAALGGVHAGGGG